MRTYPPAALSIVSVLVAATCLGCGTRSDLSESAEDAGADAGADTGSPRGAAPGTGTLRDAGGQVVTLDGASAVPSFVPADASTSFQPAASFAADAGGYYSPRTYTQ